MVVSAARAEWRFRTAPFYPPRMLPASTPRFAPYLAVPLAVSLTLGLALALGGAGCATAGTAATVSAAAGGVRGCRTEYRICTESCGEEAFTYIGRGVWVGDWRQQLTCDGDCRRRADACTAASGPQARRMPTAGKPAWGPDAAPGVWHAEYSPTRSFKDVVLARTEAVVSVEAPPVKALPAMFSARWNLREALTPGAYRMAVKTRGELRLTVDGRALALRNAEAPEHLRISEDAELGTGRLIVLEWTRADATDTLTAHWLRVDESQVPHSPATPAPAPAPAP